MYSEDQVPFFSRVVEKKDGLCTPLCVHTHMHVCISVCAHVYVSETKDRERHLSKSCQSHLIPVLDNLGFWGG